MRALRHSPWVAASMVTAAASGRAMQALAGALAAAIGRTWVDASTVCNRRAAGKLVSTTVETNWCCNEKQE